MTASIAYCLTFISLCCGEITASPATPPDILTGIELEILSFIRKSVQKKNCLMSMVTFSCDSLLYNECSRNKDISGFC